MKRLFALKIKAFKTALVAHPKSEEPIFFDKKQKAKEKRDKLNNEHNNYCHITFGPDHWRYKP